MEKLTEFVNGVRELIVTAAKRPLATILVILLLAVAAAIFFVHQVNPDFLKGKMSTIVESTNAVEFQANLGSNVIAQTFRLGSDTNKNKGVFLSITANQMEILSRHFPVSSNESNKFTLKAGVESSEATFLGISNSLTFRTCVTAVVGFLLASLSGLGFLAVKWGLKNVTASRMAAKENREIIVQQAQIDRAKGPVDPDWVYAAKSAATLLEGPVRIIAVASGKGGVGKSLLSLGLLEYYATKERTVLVDLDLHNHGITSCLAPEASIARGGKGGSLQPLYPNYKSERGLPFTTVFEELGKFSDKAKVPVTGPLEPYDEIFPKDRESYVEWKKGRPRPLGLLRFAETEFIEANYANNALFLPSVVGREQFLGSPISKLQDRPVLFFLK